MNATSPVCDKAVTPISAIKIIRIFSYEKIVQKFL